MYFNIIEVNVFFIVRNRYGMVLILYREKYFNFFELKIYNVLKVGLIWIC